MADKTIGELPALNQMQDEALIPCEYDGAAKALSGSVLSDYIYDKVEDDVEVISAIIATGPQGADGFSPVVSTSKSGGVATVSITDADGTHSFTVNDGDVSMAELTNGDASGPLATFTRLTDGLPVSSLICDINPIQAGSGTPSPTNIRAISGRTGCSVKYSGADTSDYETLSVSLGRTVYGGKLNVTTGALTVTHKLVTMDGVTNGAKFTNRTNQSSYDQYYFPDTDGGVYGRTTTGFVAEADLTAQGYACSIGKTSGMTSTTEIQAGVYVGNASGGGLVCEPVIRFPLSLGYSTVAAANTVMATLYSNGTPCQFVYLLADPVTYQLSGVQIASLLGENNIWADCGNVYVEFGDDINTALSHKADLTADNKVEASQASSKVIWVDSSRTLTADEIGCTLVCTNSPTITIPSAAMGVDGEVEVLNYGTGTVTVTTDGMLNGVTNGEADISVQYKAAVVKALAVGEMVILGEFV